MIFVNSDSLDSDFLYLNAGVFFEKFRRWAIWNSGGTDECHEFFMELSTTIVP